ncbi:hypothetical protein ES703_24170 [subsurface metagenome]
MASLAVKEERVSDIQKAGNGTWSGEAVAFCPQCKVIQTVWINDSTLIPTCKFNQIGSQIYHDCGSNQPCRLYHSW